ncbi:MAG: cellulase N-terminal Ig-like domain-containing protein, partial [Verrucomicrobiales bacterium]
MRAVIIALAFAHTSLGGEICRPQAGSHSLRIIDPSVLELEIITAKRPGKPLPCWNVPELGRAGEQDGPAGFNIRVNGQPTSSKVVKLGYKRRPLYATLGEYDMRVGTQIYLVLSAPLSLADGDRVTVGIPTSLKSPPGCKFEAEFRRNRDSPAIHINQAGYQVGSIKQAVAGYYLGSAGELPLDGSRSFYLQDVQSGRKVYEGSSERRREVGLTFSPPQYQQVHALDFSDFDRPGRYVLGIEGLGESAPFTISDGLFACIARTYALGL